MKQLQFIELFNNSLDTFKAFNNLDLGETGRDLQTAPKTIWQILNHLITWQGHQINLLIESERDFPINEQMTWIEEDQPKSQEALDRAIVTFQNQLDQVKEEILKFDLKDFELQRKLKVVQDLSVHLSFHLGEVILMRRITGNYPLPHQMKYYLN
jgi:uncharacterized damage-inducible protein DinB